MGAAEVQVSEHTGDWTQGACPRSAAQHRAHSPGSEGRAMGGGCGAVAQVLRLVGAQDSGRSALTTAGPGARSWTLPGRARSQCPPRRSRRLAGSELSAVSQGPGGPAERARAACAVGSHNTWRTRSYLRRWAALRGGNLSTRARWPPYPRPEAIPALPGLRGAATRSGVRCQQGYPLCALLPLAQLQRRRRPKVFVHLLSSSQPGSSPEMRF